MPGLPIAGAVSIVSTHILGGSFGPGKTIRASDRVKRRGGDNRGLEARVAKLEATTEHIQRDVNDLKIEVRGLRADLKSEVTSLRADLKDEVTSLRADQASLRADLKMEITNLRAESRADFRLLFSGLLTVFLGVLGMLVKIFNVV